MHGQSDEDSDDISTALYSIKPDGTDLHTVANIRQYEIRHLAGTLNWSPDGSEIWYSSDSNIIRIKADGTGVSRMKARFTGGKTRATLSPDAATVAVGVTTADGLGKDEDVYLFLMDPDGSNQRVLLRDTAEGMAGEEGVTSRQLIEWELTQYTPLLTQYTPLEEQDEETETRSALTSAACSGTEEACQSRDVTQTVWPASLGGGAPYDLEIETPTVEELLEQGLHSTGLSPVHIAFRGTANAMSSRCAWRSTARTLSQRERDTILVGT